jgi:predicted kinase
MEEAISTLYQFCGLPGAGKSTLARRLAEATQSVLLSHDKISASLTTNGLYHFEKEFSDRRRPTQDLLCTIAGEQLGNGLSVIIDSLGENDRVRTEAEEISQRFGAGFVLVYCVCLDEDTLLERLRNRDRKIPGWVDRGEEHLHRVLPHFSPPQNPNVLVQTLASIDESVAYILRVIGKK